MTKTEAQRKAYKRYYDNNKDLVINRTKAYKARNPEKVKQTIRKYQLKNKYGITPEDYDTMLSKQDNGCAICGQVCQTGYKLSVDHNHATGKVRGLLCRKHNQALGSFTLDELRATVIYMEERDG